MKIAFLGDIAFLGQFDKSQSADAEQRLSYLKEMLQGYDYVIANLESPLTNRDFTLVCKSMHLKADTSNAELLKYLGISAVSLANNHIADYGVQGIHDTIQSLEKAGIAWFGIGDKDLDLDIKGEKLNISGYCCYSSNGTHYGGQEGIQLLTFDALEKRIKQNEKRGYFSILSVHWGMEHTNYPAYEHYKLVHRLLPKCHAVLCGHHPHIVQGVESMGDALIAYSLGNAVFDKCVSKNKKLEVELNESNRKCLMLEVSIEKGHIQGHELLGYRIGPEGIEPYDIESEIEQISKALENITDVEQYENVRKEQFQAVIHEKFGKHDMQWLISRLNYYAIGARIMGTIRGKRYKKEVNRFLHG